MECLPKLNCCLFFQWLLDFRCTYQADLQIRSKFFDGSQLFPSKCSGSRVVIQNYKDSSFFDSCCNDSSSIGRKCKNWNSAGTKQFFNLGYRLWVIRKCFVWKLFKAKRTRGRNLRNIALSKKIIANIGKFFKFSNYKMANFIVFFMVPFCQFPWKILAMIFFQSVLPRSPPYHRLWLLTFKNR